MIIHIKYTNNRYDYIHARKLDTLIAAQRITKFMRPSEQAWVDIARDPIRGTKEVYYMGPERRLSHRNPFEVPA
jgi:hypothetical protein